MDSLGLQRVFRRTNLAYRMHLFGGLFQTSKKKEKTEFNVFFHHMIGMKTTGEQISILCHNGTIFDKPREKTGLAIKRHVGGGGAYPFRHCMIWILIFSFWCVQTFLVECLIVFTHNFRSSN